MLTINEKRWLVQRKGYCNWCSVKFKTDNCFWVITADLCPLYPRQVSTQDALEFSERVAVKLAGRVDACQYVTMPMSKHCMLTGCVACKLRDARLEVEEEMACRK